MIDFRHDNIFYFVTINNTFAKVDSKGDLPRNVHWYYACNFGPSSVLICTWIPHPDPDPDCLVPELWQYSISPGGTAVRLGISQKVYDLNIDLRRFALLSDKIFFMGQRNDDNKDDNPSTMCDTYIEVSVDSLL